MFAQLHQPLSKKKMKSRRKGLVCIIPLSLSLTIKKYQK